MENKEVENKEDVLVVVSKLKNYIRSASGLSTSATVCSALSSVVKEICDQAIERAKADGRKTVLERDIQLPSESAH